MFLSLYIVAEYFINLKYLSKKYGQKAMGFCLILADEEKSTSFEVLFCILALEAILTQFYDAVFQTGFFRRKSNHVVLDRDTDLGEQISLIAFGHILV